MLIIKLLNCIILKNKDENSNDKSMVRIILIIIA